MKRQLRKKEKPTPEEVRSAIEFGRPSMNEQWSGKNVLNKRVPSGLKLMLVPDSDCILRFVGYKDISDQMGKPDGSVIYLTFYDGRRIVTMPTSFAFLKVHFVEELYYYIWHQGEVDTGNGLNPMKDFMVVQLGSKGEEITVPKRVSDDGELILTDEDIEKVNYERLNYPFRE